MTRLAFVAALLASAAAFAQISVTSSFASSFNNGSTPSVNVGKSLCSADQSIDFRYDLGVVPTPGVDTVEAWVVKDSGTCSTTPGNPAAPSQQLSVPSQSSQTGTIVLRPRVGELLFTDADFPGGCQNTTSRASSPFTEFVCIRRKTAGVLGANPSVSSATLQVNFALVSPVAPSKPVATPGDSHVRLDWGSNDSGDRTYDVYVVADGTDPTTIDTGKAAVHDVSTTHADVDHDSNSTPLRNGTIYASFVRSVDGYGNASALSPVTRIEPVLIEDFYSRYRDAGGSAAGGGGCSSGGQGGLLALAALALAAVGRRRKAGAVAVLLALAPSARAADWTGLDRPPRRWLVGVKIDRYDPQIDSEAGLGGQQPYHDIFHGRAPLRYQVEVDYQVLHPFGAVLVGGTAGYWQNVGKGIYASEYVDPDNPTVVHHVGEPSGDTARLDVVPFGAIVTYRFDWLADRYQWLPIVPYLQAGLQAALWTSFSGTGSVSTRPAGGRGSGWSYGYTTALGVALDLGAVDAALAREAYVDTGIQRTSLFAEYGWTRLSDFGKSRTLILSDRAWRFGVSVEF